MSNEKTFQFQHGTIVGMFMQQEMEIEIEYPVEFDKVPTVTATIALETAPATTISAFYIYAQKQTPKGCIGRITRVCENVNSYPNLPFQLHWIAVEG